MPRSPLKPLSSAVVLFLLCASSARAYDLTSNYPGFCVEWTHQTENNATDVAVGDANDDGFPDLFVVDGSSLELWINDGTGRFNVRPGSICGFPVGSILVIDFDDDARVDVLATVLTGTGGLAMLRGLGHEQFASPVTYAEGQTYGLLCDAGIDVRGRRRILASGIETRLGFDVLEMEKEVLRVAESFLPEAQVNGFVGADFNGDGLGDVIVNRRGDDGECVTAMYPGGSDGLSAPVRIPRRWFASRIVPVDLDGDGDLDIMISGDGPQQVFRNDGTGRRWVPDDHEFWDIRSSFAADLDRDGKPEILMSHRYSQGSLIVQYQGTGDPWLEHPREYSYMQYQERAPSLDEMVATDLNGDGRIDLVTRVSGGDGYYHPPGMIGAVIARPNGELGALRFHPLNVRGDRITPARLQIDQVPALLLSGPDGVFLTSLRDNELTAPLKIGTGTFAMAIDLDSDGRDDLITSGADTTQIRLTTRNGQPGDVSARFAGRVIDVGDLDGDHHLDLLVSRTESELAVIWGRPRGFSQVSSFTMSASPWPSLKIVRIADADGDETAELVELRTTRYSGSYDQPPDMLIIYRVSRNGMLDPLTINDFPHLALDACYISDVRAANLDGVPGQELVLVNSADGFSASQLIVLRAVAGSYSLGERCSVGGESPSGLTLADFDDDGDVDAACTANMEGYMGLIHVRWNDGHGKLDGDWARRLADAWGKGAAAADFDGDGVLDIAALAPRLGGDVANLAFLFGRPWKSATVLKSALARGPNWNPDPTLAIHSISPNPARGAFAIDWTARPGVPIDIEMHDVTGRRILSERLITPGTTQRATRFEPPKNLPAGLYWVRLSQGGRSVARRVALLP